MHQYEKNKFCCMLCHFSSLHASTTLIFPTPPPFVDKLTPQKRKILIIYSLIIPPFCRHLNFPTPVIEKSSFTKLHTQLFAENNFLNAFKAVHKSKFIPF